MASVLTAAITVVLTAVSWELHGFCFASGAIYIYYISLYIYIYIYINIYIWWYVRHSANVPRLDLCQ